MKHQQGLTFIEVLIAFAILATGIVGAVAMQTMAKKGSFEAMQRSQASAIAQDILERMRVNEASGGFLANYSGTYGDGALAVPANRCNTIGNPCTPPQILANDLYEWEQRLLGSDVKKGAYNVGGIEDARGCISFNGNIATVVVSWKGRTELSDSADSANQTSKDCGSASKYRRQVMMEAVIF